MALTYRIRHHVLSWSLCEVQGGVEDVAVFCREQGVCVYIHHCCQRKPSEVLGQHFYSKTRLLEYYTSNADFKKLYGCQTKLKKIQMYIFLSLEFFFFALTAVQLFLYVCLCSRTQRWWTENDTKVKPTTLRHDTTNTTHTHKHTVFPCVYKHSGFLLGTVTDKIMDIQHLTLLLKHCQIIRALQALTVFYCSSSVAVTLLLCSTFQVTMKYKRLVFGLENTKCSI